MLPHATLRASLPICGGVKTDMYQKSDPKEATMVNLTLVTADHFDILHPQCIFWMHRCNGPLSPNMKAKFCAFTCTNGVLCIINSQVNIVSIRVFLIRSKWNADKVDVGPSLFSTCNIRRRGMRFRAGWLYVFYQSNVDVCLDKNVIFWCVYMF